MKLKLAPNKYRDLLILMTLFCSAMNVKNCEESGSWGRKSSLPFLRFAFPIRNSHDLWAFILGFVNFSIFTII